MKELIKKYSNLNNNQYIVIGGMLTYCVMSVMVLFQVCHIGTTTDIVATVVIMIVVFELLALPLFQKAYREWGQEK